MDSRRSKTVNAMQNIEAFSKPMEQKVVDLRQTILSLSLEFIKKGFFILLKNHS